MTDDEQRAVVSDLYAERDAAKRNLACLRIKARRLSEALTFAASRLVELSDVHRDPDDYVAAITIQLREPFDRDSLLALIDEIHEAEGTVRRINEELRAAGVPD